MLNFGNRKRLQQPGTHFLSRQRPLAVAAFSACGQRNFQALASAHHVVSTLRVLLSGSLLPLFFL